jgi:hypothetical protein
VCSVCDILGFYPAVKHIYYRQRGNPELLQLLFVLRQNSFPLLRRSHKSEYIENFNHVGIKYMKLKTFNFGNKSRFLNYL